ncbi:MULTISPECIES: sulfate/molybdate ABC transporter ATP-binding protein [unclassified Caulobacter]|uniref:sulfate/molybdate ABC transporter ATP-binding protein n=1 Tax=unclassified Caulobacter TaxID=2648921 RepID=UPI000D3D2FDD|nr:MULTISPECIES: sulfate/molybdate ABC transporter ATP-binding protein [unclassified Caulobacter]PTS89708.1 sulfate ABC transporter ATP-binding protein [Caulobacter sp. HMWF009]PTT08731.1 sulfate ABC transporter ATP-binding protein [Caulobacter sp. HMWF025]
MTISIRSVEKKFGRYPALNKVGLEIADGELLALLGPSGSGKTTLLRVIAGLEFPDAGQVLFHDQDVTFASAAARRVGFVFQQYALFKHMTVAKNIAFGLDVRKGKDKPSKVEITRRVDELLRLVELEGLGGRYPSQLSGGQRQRVALSRALAVQPSVLLLDEPFGALDATVRKSLRKELRRVHDATGVTTIFVTHDQEEALDLADRVAILNQGVIEQVGTPEQVHDHPVSPFVCGFVGESNRFEGVVSGGRFTSGSVFLPATGLADGPAVAFARPHDFSLDGSGFEVRVNRVHIQGALAHVDAETADGRRIDVVTSRDQAEHFTGTVRLAARKAHVFPA